MKQTFVVAIESNVAWDVSQIAKALAPIGTRGGITVSEVDAEKSIAFVFTDQYSRWRINAHGERRTTIRHGKQQVY